MMFAPQSMGYKTKESRPVRKPLFIVQFLRLIFNFNVFDIKRRFD
jgi:hypothetical protein